MASSDSPHVSGAAHHPGNAPVPPHPGALRVGENEREDVIERIKTAFAEGWLDLAEFDLRTHLALTARTRAELAPLVVDLHSVPISSAPPRSRPRPTAAERAWAMLSHWLGFATSFVGPLVMLVTKGRRSPFVRHQSVEALNFQLTFVLVQLLMVVVVGFTFGLGALLYVPLMIGWIVLTVAGGIGAAAGEAFRYPINIRIIPPRS